MSETVIEALGSADALDRAMREGGPPAIIDVLVASASQGDDPRVLLDSLLLQARYELNLPLISNGPLSAIPEPLRTRYEDRYVDALRRVGHWLLELGEVPAAWPYFRTIGEREPIAHALDSAKLEKGGEQVGQYIDIALYQNAHPKRGFAWVLEHYGTCSAISAFEHLPNDEAIRGACAANLVRVLHEQLSSNLRAEITRVGQARPSPETSIPALIAGRDWLFSDEAYHIDISHLASVVRMQPLLTERSDQLLALELCEYGRRLAPRLRYDDPPPFEKTYEDHAAYLNAILGRDVDAALTHFRGKLKDAETEDAQSYAQVLVRLFSRLQRWDEAIELAEQHFPDVPDSHLSCPSFAQLCQTAGRLDRLAQVSRGCGNLVNLAAALLTQAKSAGHGFDRKEGALPQS